MEVPESDGTGGEAREMLIRDISRSDCRCGAVITPEQHLMQISGDPLLVRELLLRAECAGPAPLGPSSLAGGVTIALTGSSLTTGVVAQASLHVRLKHYERREPLRETSCFPLVFEPSREDREEALDLDPCHRQSASLTSGSNPGVVFWALTLTFTMLLLTLLFVPG